MPRCCNQNLKNVLLDNELTNWAIGGIGQTDEVNSR